MQTNQPMQFSERIITQAFEKHHDIYVSKKDWAIDHHLEQWKRAYSAFNHGSTNDFNDLYKILKNNWHVFRGHKNPKSASEIYDILKGLDQNTRELSLSELVNFTNLKKQNLWHEINKVKDIKINKYGPSLVAISKFLHFFNPKLFVIVDNAVIWHFVFGHEWIWSQIEEIYDCLPNEIGIDRSQASNFKYYLAILLWASEIINANQKIVELFSSYVQEKANNKNNIPPDLDKYEAAAIEWFLLGVVQITPAWYII